MTWKCFYDKRLQWNTLEGRLKGNPEEEKKQSHYTIEFQSFNSLMLDKSKRNQSHDMIGIPPEGQMIYSSLSEGVI